LKVFPSYTPAQLLSDVGEALLYQAETIYAAENDWHRVEENGKGGTSNGFRERWERATGRSWND
jgi:hypothetical protein